MVSAEVPKGLLVEAPLPALVAELRAQRRASCPDRIRLGTALHAGEVRYDEHW